MAELRAINAGLDVIENLEGKSCTVYSDSRAALQTIAQFNPDHPQARDIQSKLLRAHARYNTVTLCWIPSHCGIKGNERADMMAKKAANMDAQWASRPVYYRDVYAYLND